MTNFPTYPGTDSAAAPATSPPRRPGVLVAAVVGSVLVAALTTVSQLLGIIGGREAINDELREQLGTTAGVPSEQLDDAYATLQARAILGFVLAGLALIFALLAARRGSLAARIVLALVLVADVLLLLRAVTDVLPGAGKVAGGAAIALAVGVLLMLFLPPIGRYRQATRAAAG